MTSPRSTHVDPSHKSPNPAPVLLAVGARLTFFAPGALDVESLWAWARDLEPYRVRVRGRPLSSRPKREFGIRDDKGRLPLYTFGQHREDWGLVEPMPPVLAAMCARLNARFDTDCNHAIVTFCRDGKTYHIPPHQDKAHSKESSRGVEDHAPILNLVLCEPNGVRPFQIVEKDGTVVEEWPTTHGSLVLLTAEDNARYWHTVPKDRSVTGLRISVVFREATRKLMDPATGAVYEWDARAQVHKRTR